MGTAIKHPVSDWAKLSSVFFDIGALLTLRAERQSAQMSKITNESLARSDTGYFIAVPIWHSGRKRIKLPTSFDTGISVCIQELFYECDATLQQFHVVLVSMSAAFACIPCGLQSLQVCHATCHPSKLSSRLRLANLFENQIQLRNMATIMD